MPARTAGVACMAGAGARDTSSCKLILAIFAWIMLLSVPGPLNDGLSCLLTAAMAHGERLVGRRGYVFQSV